MKYSQEKFFIRFLVHLGVRDLRIKVDDNNKCLLIGPAVEVFSGEIF
ncbi:MAG: hypothetical protein IJS99_11045 [Synergistaceae bacterium]|nr:hypothetical protein [Synergistaceae bacterium]